MRNSKKIFLSAGLFFLTFCAALFFFELFLRSTEIMLPSFVYDNPVLGRTHSPSSKVNLITAEGFYLGGINKFGYVGTAYPKGKPSDVLRIALIGDSYIEGFQLFERDHFKTYMEQEISKKLKTKVEVLNFGIGGADLRGMYLRYDKLAKAYNPDIALFFVKKEDLVKRDILPMPELYLINDSIAFGTNFLEAPDSKLRQKFAFVRNYSIGNLFKEVFEVFYNGLWSAVVFDKFYPAGKTLKKNSTTVDSFRDDKFYSMNKIILESFTNKQNEKYHPIIVKIDDFPEYYENLIKKLNLKVFLLNNELDKYNPKDLTYWKASNKIGHWNQSAHVIVAKFLIEEIV